MLTAIRIYVYYSSMKTKLPKTAKTAYLYSDGHAIVLHEDNHPKAGRVEWAEAYEKLGPECRFAGRIIFHNINWYGTFALAARSAQVSATAPGVEHGSDNTKRQGIAVGNFSIRLEKDERSALHWLIFPEFISSDITLQPIGHAETFASDVKDGYWGMVKVSKVHRAPVAVQESVAA